MRKLESDSKFYQYPLTKKVHIVCALCAGVFQPVQMDLPANLRVFSQQKNRQALRSFRLTLIRAAIKKCIEWRL
jgi:hypothetical protein